MRPYQWIELTGLAFVAIAAFWELFIAIPKEAELAQIRFELLYFDNIATARNEPLSGRSALASCMLTAQQFEDGPVTFDDVMNGTIPMNRPWHETPKAIDYCREKLLDNEFDSNFDAWQLQQQAGLAFIIGSIMVLYGRYNELKRQ